MFGVLRVLRLVRRRHLLLLLLLLPVWCFATDLRMRAVQFKAFRIFRLTRYSLSLQA
jgi:hypothetical protein